MDCNQKKECALGRLIIFEWANHFFFFFFFCSLLNITMDYRRPPLVPRAFVQLLPIRFSSLISVAFHLHHVPFGFPGDY